MNDPTLNPEVVGDAVKELRVLDDTGVVAGVLLLDRLYLELAAAVQRGLVDPGRLLALEKPPGKGRGRAGVGAAQVDLTQKTLNKYPLNIVSYKTELCLTCDLQLVKISLPMSVICVRCLEEGVLLTTWELRPSPFTVAAVTQNWCCVPGLSWDTRRLAPLPDTLWLV